MENAGIIDTLIREKKPHLLPHGCTSLKDLTRTSNEAVCTNRFFDPLILFKNFQTDGYRLLGSERVH
jgi:hypothetical protein